MSAATARAEARRKAILARGGDRLAKLTTSARGEDATYMPHDQQAAHNTALNEFVGETSGANMPKPLDIEEVRKPSPAPTLSAASSTKAGSPGPDPNVWSPEDQQRFIEALLSGTQQTGGMPEFPHLQQRIASLSSTAGRRSVSREGSAPPFDTFPPSMFPLDAQFDQQAKNVTGGQIGQIQKTLFQKLIPAIHMLAFGCLLLWFTLWQGGQYSFLNNGGDMVPTGSAKQKFWDRWAELARRQSLFTVQESSGVNFFWAFATLEIVLHSARLVSGFDDLQPSGFVSLALSNLPSNISTIVFNLLRYFQMSAMLLDDIAWVVVLLGFLIYIATLITP